MLGDIRVGVFDPGDAAYHISAEVHCLPHQFLSAWLAYQSVLSKSNRLYIHDAFEFVTRLDEGFYSFELAL